MSDEMHFISKPQPTNVCQMVWTTMSAAITCPLSCQRFGVKPPSWNSSIALTARKPTRSLECRAKKTDHCEGREAQDWCTGWKKNAIAISAAVTVAISGASGAYAAGNLGSSDDLFDPMSYIGRWYEVASLKQGFAGEGQEDCHCTQGIYMPKELENGAIGISVNTFCLHGGPKGRISGIQGSVSCAQPALLKLLPEFETEFERREGIVAKCVLKFPSIPFIPAEPYDVIATDYDSYALVQGAADTSFVQIYSRTPNPGKEFLDARLKQLEEFGYPVKLIKETPQDCPTIPVKNLMSMMTKGSEMEVMMTNTMSSPVEVDFEDFDVAFAGPRNIFSSIKDFFNLSKQNYAN
ncbi:hypothetical protein BSKO_07960 [Bryopsis sp. KO-2023]|nr:hypothetical protein BSKO_07960 [Bryopsis sp. KO-2023]